MQVVAVKPVARWQIWLGKWLGIMSLNAVLLAISGISVYGLLLWRANKLPPREQAILRNEVLVARGSAKERSYDKEIQDETTRRLRERLEKNPVSTADFKEVEKQIREQVKADLQVVPAGYSRPWQIELGIAKNWLHDRHLQVRLKFNAADRSASGTFYGIVRVGVPQKTKLYQSDTLSLAPDTFHEIPIPPDLYDDQGILTVTFLNPNNTALLFTLDEGMEVLYPEGGFGLNFARGRRNYFLLDGIAFRNWSRGSHVPLLSCRSLFCDGHFGSRQLQQPAGIDDRGRRAGQLQRRERGPHQHASGLDSDPGI